MKKSIVLGILGLAAVTNTSHSTGCIFLDNYDTSGPNVTYGWGLAPPGTGLNAGYTAGIYYAYGNVVSRVAPDPSELMDPTTLYSGFILGTGPGSSAEFYTSSFDTPGEFHALQAFAIAGNPGDIITAMVVAYDGPSYQSTTHRGHSPAFAMPLTPITSPYPNSVGNYMSGFEVGMPEPGTLALAGLGGLSLWLMRLRKA